MTEQTVEQTAWLAEYLRPLMMLGLPCHDDPILNGQGDLNGSAWRWNQPGKPMPNTHGRAPIDAFPAWFAAQFGGYILEDS